MLCLKVRSFQLLDVCFGLIRSTFLFVPDGPALLFLTLVTSNVRNCRRPSSRLHAIEIMADLCLHLSDESKLDRVCPFLVALLFDDAPVVRAASIQALVQTVCIFFYSSGSYRYPVELILMQLENIEILTPSNMAIITEYIFPNAWHLAKDEEISVRVAYAGSIASLTETGCRFLEISESFRTRGGTALFAEETDEHAPFNEVWIPPLFSRQSFSNISHRVSN